MTTIRTPDELVAMFKKMVDTNGLRNPTFYASLNLLAPDRLEEVWKEVERQGYERPKRFLKDAEKPEDKPASDKTHGIYWSDEEITTVAIGIWNLRKNDPTSTFLQLLVKAQEIRLPPERRRKITAIKHVPTIIERYQQINLQVREDAKEVELLRQLQTPEKSPEELSDEEIMLRYAEYVLHNITPEEIVEKYGCEPLLDVMLLPKVSAFAAARNAEQLQLQNESLEFLTEFIADIEDVLESKPKFAKPDIFDQERNSRRSQLTPYAEYPAEPKKKRVSILGLKPGQAHIVRRKLEHLVDLKFVDKNLKKGLGKDNCDIYVLFKGFASHSMEDQIKQNLNGAKFILHSGGITLMIQKIETELAKGV